MPLFNDQGKSMFDTYEPEFDKSSPSYKAPAVPAGAPTPEPAPAPAPVAPGASPISALLQNPAFLAFVQAAGMEEEVLSKDAARRRLALDEALGLQTEDIQDRGQQQRKSIMGGQESRGVFRSGQTQEMVGNQEREQARNLSLAELSNATQKGDLESALALARIRNQGSIVENAINTATGQYNSNAADDIDAMEGLPQAMPSATSMYGPLPAVTIPKPSINKATTGSIGRPRRYV